MERYMSAQQVADALGVSIATVYAYVSRGLIRSEATSSGQRNRRYYREDVDQLKRRQDQRRHPEKTVESALHWGAPLLESSLTLIAEGRLYYRGLDAIDLARRHSIEAVAALLWTDHLEAKQTKMWTETGSLFTSVHGEAWPEFPKAAPFERMQLMLPLAALEDPAAYDLRPAGVVQSGARIVRLLAATATDGPADAGGIAAMLQRAWSPDQDNAARLINMALVLCADHELNVSSFTARCVASAGSTPYAVVTAGLAALQGVRHGGSTARVAALIQEIGGADDVPTALVNRLKRGDSLPGFGHPLYPDGDPRARALMEAIGERYADSEAVYQAHAVIRHVRDLTGEHPNIDFGLVTLASVLGLPSGAPLALFALGRSVGWIGHALEQYATGQLIRPRARYIGRQPEI